MKAYFSGNLSAPLCGVVRFYLLAGDLRQDEHKIIAHIDGKSFDVEIDESSRFKEGVAININTHLLSNGPHEITFNRAKLFHKDASAPFRFQVLNQGPLAETVRESLVRNSVPTVFAGHCDSAMYDYADTTLLPWFDREGAEYELQRRVASGQVPVEHQEPIHSFIKEGYAILPQTVPEEIVDQAVAALDDAVKTGYQGYVYGESTRLEHMHRKYPAVRELWKWAPVERFLSSVFGVRPRACQTLTYIFGSQQDAHQDTIHLTPFPAGYMCGVWIALEDVKLGAGELEVYPGSHRLPRVRMAEVGCAKVTGDWREFGQKVVTNWQESLASYNKEKYIAKRGQVLVWHENLAHGGAPRTDKSLPRRSVVSHYFADGSIGYYDSTGLPAGVDR